MSHSTSKGSRPCSAAISPMVRPTYWPVLRLHDVEDALGRPVGQADASGPGDLACSSSFARAAGSARIAVFSASGRVITCSQPGRASSTKPAANERRMPKRLGDGEGDDLAAPGPGDVAGRQLVLDVRRARAALITRMFQLSGRWAAADMSAMSSLAHGSNGPDHREELERGALVLGRRRGTARRAPARWRSATAPCGRRRRCGCGPTTTRSRCRRPRGRRGGAGPWP